MMNTMDLFLLSSNINEELWENLELETGSGMKTDTFFEVFNTYCGDMWYHHNFRGKRYDEGYDKRIANEADSWIFRTTFVWILFQQFYNLMDTLIVGRFLGVDDLAAVGSTGSVNFLIIGFCMGVCNGFAIPLAHKFGAGDYKACVAL